MKIENEKLKAKIVIDTKVSQERLKEAEKKIIVEKEKRIEAEIAATHADTVQCPHCHKTFTLGVRK